MINKQVDGGLYNEILKIKNGDYSSYDTFYSITADYIYGLICSIIKEKEHADAIIMNVYNEICNRISECEPEDVFYVWAGRLTTYYIFSYATEMGMNLEYQNVHGDGMFYENVYEDTEKFISAQVLNSMEYMRVVKRFVDDLPMIHNIILQYYYYEGMSVTDISAYIGVERIYVANVLKYIRKQLKEFIYVNANQGMEMYSLSEIPLFWVAFDSIMEGTISSSVASIVMNQSSGVAMSGAANTYYNVSAGFSSVEDDQVTLMMDVQNGFSEGGQGAGYSSAGMNSTGASASGMSMNPAVVGTSGMNMNTAGIGTPGMNIGPMELSGLGNVPAGTTAVAATTTAGTGIAVKIIAGVAIAGVLTAGGIGIHHILTDDDKKDEVATMTDASDTDASDTDATEETSTEAATEELSYEEIRTAAFEDFLANPGAYNYLMYDNDGIYRRANYYTYQNCDSDPEEELAIAVRDDGFGVAFLDVDPETGELYPLYGSILLEQAAQAITDDVLWMQAYDNKMGELIWGEYATGDGAFLLNATLHDFDNNGIPELFVAADTSANSYGYTFADGQIKDVGLSLGHFSNYYVKDNYLIVDGSTGGVPGDRWFEVYEFTNNIFTLVEGYTLLYIQNSQGQEYILEGLDPMNQDANNIAFGDFQGIVGNYGLEVTSSVYESGYTYSYTVVDDNVSVLTYTDYSNNYGDLANIIWNSPYPDAQ